MNGDIWLDAEYDSGIPGCPGARFVVNLNAPPLDLETVDSDRYHDHSHYARPNKVSVSHGEACLNRLPKSFRVLFVDDDMMLVSANADNIVDGLHSTAVFSLFVRLRGSLAEVVWAFHQTNPSRMGN